MNLRQKDYFMMNRKGQVLVVFVLILPLILTFLGLIIDIGNSLIIRKKYENAIKDVIIYQYKEIDEFTDDESNDSEGDSSEVVHKEVDLDLITRNIKEAIRDYDEVTLNIKDDVLIANVKYHYKSIFGTLFNIGLNNIDLKVRYDINNKRIVKG